MTAALIKKGGRTQKKTNLLTPGLWTSHLQNCEKNKCLFFKLLSLWLFCYGHSPSKRIHPHLQKSKCKNINCMCSENV